jgi:DNA-binding transcriptional LysR family regulator
VIKSIYDRTVELRQLRYLIAIDDSGHVGRAAEALYVSQPALSYALRNLEAEMGVQLFDRHARGVTATEAGREVIREARAAVMAADRVTRRSRPVPPWAGRPAASRLRGDRGRAAHHEVPRGIRQAVPGRAGRAEAV